MIRAMMITIELSQALAGIEFVYYTFPALLIFYFLTAQIFSVCTLQAQSLHVLDQRVHRGCILTLTIVAAGTYIIEAIAAAIRYFHSVNWNPGQDRMFYLIASSVALAVEALIFRDTEFPVWYPYYGTWFIAILVEPVFLISQILSYNSTSISDVAFITIQVLRLCCFLALPFLYFGFRSDMNSYTLSNPERQSLLRINLSSNTSCAESAENDTAYGSAPAVEGQDSMSIEEDAATSEDEWLAKRQKAKERILKRLKQDGNWFTYIKGFSELLSYAWPIHKASLQFRTVLLAACLLISNVLNVLVPRQMGVMIDNMSAYAQGDSTRNIWLPVVAYAVLLFVNGDAGIGWIRKWLWLPLEQRSYVALSTASQAHIMSLSSDFHESDNKNTSDLMQAATTGRSVIDLLETICFQVVPMFVDSVIAFGYLWFLFGPFMGLIVATTFFSYLYITAKFIAATAEQRRQYTAVHRKEYIVGHQSLESWNIASLFNMIPHEQQRYERAVNSHMSSKRIQEFSSQYMNAAQSLTMTCGLIGGLYLATFQVAKEGKSIGELTTFLAYWAQLQGPLFFFSSVFKTIFHRLMDAERLLELFKMKPTVTDTPDAKPLALRKGEIKFDHVSFAYDVRKPILKNVNFVVPAGKTVALVGPTGSGKSTMLKLLDRFYDVKSGCISIDGQDIRAVTLKSLRDNIGVVPQEPMLFNDSIMNNIRYARLTASTEEIHNACRAAALHDKIMTFPDRYYTKIGDRGVKLSGGEKQRIAIARAILKRPEIILLDEATSAVDTETEHTIREGFKKLCEDRTTIIVAHRLSTIMQSDRILVVIDGEIIEEGSHHELIRARGKYHDLWSKQVFVEPEVEQPNPMMMEAGPEECVSVKGGEMAKRVGSIAVTVG